MQSIEISFTSYAIIGLTLLVSAGSAAGYLYKLPGKSRAMQAFIAFLLLVVLSGVATILGNSIVLWGELFLPWQDSWILAGGVALLLFAYTLSVDGLSREGKLVVMGTSILAAAAILYCIYFDYLFLFHWTPALNESDLYYLLLPLATVIIVLIFLRRAVYFSVQDEPAAGPAARVSWLHHLLYPRGAEAKTLRNLALALSLAFLPAIQTVLRIPWPVGYFLSNLGSLLAITTITLVYFNYAPEVNSFMAKLVGVTLAAVLLLLAIVGSIDVYMDGREYTALIERFGAVRVTRETYISLVVQQWLIVMLISSGVVLLVFPIFFRRILVHPLQNLLTGIGRLNEGDVDTAVPVSFNDEIGYVTASFNALSVKLKQSQVRQSELIGELQASYAELEERISERTEELSTFTDLTMISGEEADEASLLRPALDRIMELGLCEALAVHLLAGSAQELQLVSSRGLRDDEQRAMARIQWGRGLAAPAGGSSWPVLASSGKAAQALPAELQLDRYPTFLGCPLVAGEQSHGWLSCYRSAGRPFAAGEASLFAALARQVGVIIENYRLREELKQTVASVERRRLGRDLHDSVTQLLYGMTLFTRSAKEAMEDGDKERLGRSLQRLSETALHALREMRIMLFELQPPSLAEEGLADALKKRLDMVERRVGVEVTFAIDAETVRPAQIERQLYYVAIEALNNAFKHGRADRISLAITEEGGVLAMLVTDNGCGFDTHQVSAGIGLPSMRQRVESIGGQLRIVSSPGEGSSLQARVPVQSWVELRQESRS